VAAIACAILAAFSGAAASAPTTAKLTTITVDTLPIANGLPLDLGIKKGFFEAQGIEISKKTLQSGNDIVLALANNNGDIGYVGWVPAMIARTQGIPLSAVAASDVEGTSEADNWQNIMVKGDSSIRRPADLAGKTIAVNALKGVGEVMIKAALKKVGVNPNSIKLVAIPFPAMRAALRNGQIDAMWAPEPFVTQALNLDGARIVMAPGPVLGKFWPIGCYVALNAWTRKNPALAKKFHAAINKSLAYAQAHPDEIRALLPAATQNIRLPIWSPLIDRAKLQQLARYSKEFGVINALPNMTQLVPSSILGGKTLQATVGPGSFLAFRLDGRAIRTLKAGKYTIVVSDKSRTGNFHIKGPRLDKKTSLKGTGRSTWTITLRKGRYHYMSDARPAAKGTVRVT
jgi:NitT/TauT family transport system substrate-binding protein